MKTDGMPMVSVCMITYNHGPYIRQALDSILAQNCPFSCELVIGEDCSSDDTMAVCREYASEHPAITLLPSERNLGMLPNFFRTIEACNGKYIAFCEGDDYWTDPGKLVKQVAFLEENHDYGMVCTDYGKLFQNTGVIRRHCFDRPAYRNEVLFSDYLADMSTISTATVMARKEIIDQYLTETDQELRSRFYVGDSPMWLFIAAKSRIGVLPDETAVYRILENSACHITSHEKHYSFVMNGLANAEYFLVKYGNSDPSLMAEIRRKRLKAELFHSFRTHDGDRAGLVRQEMKKIPMDTKQKFWSLVMQAGASCRVANRIISFILQLSRQGIGLSKSKQMMR